MGAKTLATYLGELSAGASLGAGDKIPTLEGGAMVYFEGSGFQVADADLTTIAGLSPSNDDFLQRKSGAWTNRTIAQVKTDLGVLGETEITGTITGLDPVLVNAFLIPDTNPYLIQANVIVKCTDAGAGTVVVGEARANTFIAVFVNNEEIVASQDEPQNDASMAETGIVFLDIVSSQLRLSITPPSDTGAADSEYSYKIRISGFSL